MGIFLSLDHVKGTKRNLCTKFGDSSLHLRYYFEFFSNTMAYAGASAGLYNRAMHGEFGDSGARYHKF